MNGINEPKGIVYVDIPLECDSQVDVAKAVRGERFCKFFSHLAIKYKQEYGKIPVLIIDNASRLAPEHQKLLNLFQDYAKNGADKGIVTVVFMSSEGYVLRRMMGKSIMFVVLLLCAN